MNYTDPSKVVSPKSSVSDVRVIEDKGEGSFSIARLRYDSREAIACRWNGSKEDKNGHPNTRGIPTWFLMPPEMRDETLEGVIRRAKTERPQIFDELEKIRAEYSAQTAPGTMITTHLIKGDLALLDANLLVELIKKDEELKKINVDVFDLDNEGNRTNNPISLIFGKLHITLFQEIEH